MIKSQAEEFDRFQRATGVHRPALGLITERVSGEQWGQSNGLPNKRSSPSIPVGSRDRDGSLAAYRSQMLTDADAGRVYGAFARCALLENVARVETNRLVAGAELGTPADFFRQVLSYFALLGQLTYPSTTQISATPDLFDTALRRLKAKAKISKRTTDHPLMLK